MTITIKAKRDADTAYRDQIMEYCVYRGISVRLEQDDQYDYINLRGRSNSLYGLRNFLQERQREMA